MTQWRHSGICGTKESLPFSLEGHLLGVDATLLICRWTPSQTPFVNLWLMQMERKGPAWNEGWTEGKSEHKQVLGWQSLLPVLLTHIPTLGVHSFIWEHSPAPSWLADVQLRDAHSWSLGYIDFLCNLGCSTYVFGISIKSSTFSSHWVLSPLTNLTCKELTVQKTLAFLYCTEWGKLLAPV